MTDEPSSLASDTVRDERNAMRFLLEAGELLASSLDYRETLASIARLAVPRLADFAIIDLIQSDGTVRREQCVHVDPAREASLRELARFARTDPPDLTSPTAYAAATGEPVFVPEVPADLSNISFQPEQLEIIRELRVRSLIAAPLTAHDRVMGALTLGRAEGSELYDRTHYDLVLDLARRAALAVAHARLFRDADAAREAAEYSRAALQGLVHASDHVILELDAEGRYLSVAPTSAPRMYRPADEVLGRTVHEIFPPDIARQFADWITTAVRERRSVEIEYPLDIEGRTIWFAGSISPIGTDRVVWVVRDITNRKEAEEALARSERRFRATFEQAAVGICHSDLNGRFLRFNQRLCDIVGCARDDLSRRTFWDLTHPADRPAHEIQMQRLIAGEIESFTQECRYLRSDGSAVWVSVTRSLVRQENGDPDYFVSVVQDVHERRALEEQLLRAQKMEAVGRLAGGVAHEFNNALTTITGFSDLLLAVMPADEPLREDVEEISRAAWRAAGVANRLLAFSSSEAARPEVIDVSGVVAGAQRMLTHLIGEDVELQVELDPEPLRVHADRRQLEQVVVNLVMNARDAMSGGGRLTVATGRRRVDAAEAARLEGLAPGHYVQLTVRDSGEGMSPDIQARIFDPFFTTKPPGKGTGLGLSIVYGIVRRAGGALEVESEVGAGSVFRIYLPQIAAPEAEPATRDAPPTIRRHNGRILLVEDDSGVRGLTERVMRRLGFDVLVAATPAEALRLLTEDPRPLDLLVTDVVMPGMSGRELAGTLKGLQPHLRVLFTSGYAGARMHRRQPGVAGSVFLEKPFAPEELERAIREALQR